MPLALSFKPVRRAFLTRLSDYYSPLTAFASASTTIFKSAIAKRNRRRLFEELGSICCTRRGQEDAYRPQTV